MKRKLLSLLLCLAMLCSLFTVAAAAAGDYPDLPEEGYWSYAALQAAVENGLLRGREDGSLDPRGTLKRAEMAAIVNRAFGAADKDSIGNYTDVPLNAWYYDDIAKAVRMGTFQGSGSGLMEPEKPITREQAFTVIARSFLLEDGDPAVLEQFPDAGEIADYARGSIAALAAAGYVRGTQAGLEPKAYITREAFAQVFYNVLGTYVRAAGEYSADAAGNLMVNVPGVTLKDMKIDGDLIVGEGVGDGELTLDGTEVTGRLVIRGGGEHSIILKNKSTVGSARIGKTGDGGVRLRTEEGCRIQAVYVADGKDQIILDGEFNQIVIDTDAPVVLANALVTGLTLKAESADVKLEGQTEISAVLVQESAQGAKLTLEEEAKVASLDSAAEGFTVDGDGTLETARVSGDNTMVYTEGTSLTVAEDTQGVMENNKAVEAGETVVTEKPTISSHGTGTQTGGGSYIPTPQPPAKAPVWSVVKEDKTRVPYDTLEAAMAAAEQDVRTETYTEDGSTVTWYWYAPIVFTGSAELSELKLPAGFVLCVMGSLKVNGVVEGEAFQLQEDGRILSSSELTVETDGTDLGALYTPELSIGFLPDCDIQLTGEAADDNTYFNGFFMAPREGWTELDIIGVDAKLNKDVSLSGFYFGSWAQEEDSHVLTVPAGKTLSLESCTLNLTVKVEEGAELDFTDGGELRSQCVLENAGTVTLTTWIDLNNGAALVNDGELRLRVTEDGDGDVYNSGINVNADCVLENNGLIYLESGENWGDGGYLQVNGGKLLNNAGGKIENNNFIELYCGGALENAGTLTNYRRLYMGVGETQTVTRNDGEPEVEGIAAPGILVNTGTLTNQEGAELRVEGAAVTLGGTVANYGHMEFDEIPARDRTVVLESTEGEPGEDENWWGYDWENPGSYWKILRDEYTAEKTIPCTVTLTGTLDNFGRLNLVSAPFTLEAGATLNNRSDMDVWQQEYWEFPELAAAESAFTVKGTFNNGAVTNVGEQNNGSWARFCLISGKFENQGRVVNNGDLSIELAAYVQAKDAVMDNYNTAGLNFYGASLTVPSGAEFKNEGRMSITDPYGKDAAGKELKPCDLSGFPDFFTGWMEDGNDSGWCEYSAEVYDLAGFKAANAEQARRIAAWEDDEIEAPDDRYNQLRFTGNITLTEDTTLDLFRDYWLGGHNEYLWQKWDEETQRNVLAEEGDPEAWYSMKWVGSTLTVPQGVTLTVARENALRVDGMQERLTWFDPNVLKVEGKLVVEAEQEASEENDWSWYECGLVEIWSCGSFVCTGTVDNGGVFEIRYPEHGTWNEEKWDADYDGTFSRPAECPVTGAPENAVKAAEVRSGAGFLTAAAGDYHRLYIREDCCVTLTKDVTVPMDINVEPGSGLIVEHGAALTLGGHLFNDGDISVYGDLTVTAKGSIDNNDNLEIGAVSGSEKAALRLFGCLDSRYGSRLYTYATGSIIVEQGAELYNWNGDALNVVLNGVPSDAAGIVFPEDITLTGSPEDYTDYFFSDCEFQGNVTVLYAQGDGEIWVGFNDSAVFAEGKKVFVKAAGTVTNKNDVIDMVTLDGVKGLDIQAEISARACCYEEGEYTLNGITVVTEWVPSEDDDPYDLSGNCQVRFETHDEDPENIFDTAVFQVDSDQRTKVSLKGNAAQEGFDELRLQQGNIYLVELDTQYVDLEDETYFTNVCVNTEFQPTVVDLGANKKNVFVNFDKDWDCSFAELTAGEGTDIRVSGSWILWDDEEGNYVSSQLAVNDCQINPHIFGCREASSSGGVYIGIKDDDVIYWFPYDFAYGDDTGDEEKTHLYRTSDDPDAWFTAGPGTDNEEYLDETLGIVLPGDVVVFVDGIPVKPEWNDPRT